MGLHDDVDRAAQAGALRAIPNGYQTEAVSGSNATHDLSSFGADNVDLRGKQVFLVARGVDITFRRFGGVAPTLTAGQGFVLADTDREELWVPSEVSGAGTSLRTIASGAGSLDILYDDDQ